MPGDTDVRTIELIPGGWYAVAGDKPALVPDSLVQDTIESKLMDAGIGTIRVYFDKAQLPPEVGDAVRNAAGADVWATGQYTGQSKATLPLPTAILVVEKMRVEPTKPRPIEPVRPGQGDEVKTSTIIVATVGILTVTGALLGVAWWLLKKRKKKNGRRRKKKKATT